MARISIPTTARMPSSLRVDSSNPMVQKVLSRLSRPSLLSLALDWLDDKNQSLSAPYLDDPDGHGDPDDFYPAAQSPEELQELYADMQQRKGSRREVVDRMLEGDWRHGLSLYQLAMADLQYLYDHPLSQKWSAYRIVPLKTPSQDADVDEPDKIDKKSLTIPRFHPSTFLQNLQAQVPPDVKAHYNFDRHRNLPLLLLRIFILDSPYNTALAASRAGGGDAIPATFETSRTVYVAFPDASPHIYISKSAALGGTAPATGETKSLRTLVVEGIPKALSRPRERYTLQSTSLSTRNLRELVHRRGPGRANAAGGGWAVYADEKVRESPLDTALPTPPLSERDGDDDGRGPVAARGRKRAASPDAVRDQRDAKRRRLVARARFGDSARPGDGLGVERVDVLIEDPFLSAASLDGAEHEDGGDEEADVPVVRRRSKGRRSNVEQDLEREKTAREDAGEDGQWRPAVRITFHGQHVFAGIRQLVECGIVDGERMPGWMTGEEGVTIGVVQHGRIRGHKGSGV